MPRMNISPEVENSADLPDGFKERYLQAKLAEFWCRHDPTEESIYDAIAAEQRYETFCRSFMTMIPPAFALHPNKTWDQQLPTLPLQRQVLHIAIFESLCYNFRPILLQDADFLQRLPSYKKVLILSQKRSLAVAALKLLRSVSNLHVAMGVSHTRYPGIIGPTFEAAVPLIYLYADRCFPGDTFEGVPSSNMNIKEDPLVADMDAITRERCMQGAREALNRLQTLAEVSTLAEAGARTLSCLIKRVEGSMELSEGQTGSEPAETTTTHIPEAWGGGNVADYVGTYAATDLLWESGPGAAHANWEDMMGLSSTLEPGDMSSFGLDRSEQL